jgi:hypothetical protein
MRHCCLKSCFDQFKQGTFDILNVFVHSNRNSLPVLFCPSVTSGLVVGSCEIYNRSVGSVFNMNIDFDSVVSWQFTPPSDTPRTCHGPSTWLVNALTDSSSLDPLACYTPAIIDKLFDVRRIEPQRAPAWSHLDRREVRSALARSVLDDPRNAHSQLICDILRFHKLPYWRNLYTDDR